MKHTITGDETCAYEYDTQTSRQSSEWRYDDEPRPKNRAKVGVVHSEFLPEGQTVNKEYYLGILRRLCESNCGRKIPRFCTTTTHHLTKLRL
ncbi:hypothetical protein NQ318_015024 [Aromia moschata]|uniref:Uncharacterized protein n=1 Tax=Aromia moschata TaxID=1265417 RepID=A0AAV8YW44_9CUCU|nr:hypothetical protein NQ318_015024 [Aromia moschata]